mgnify:CR=1 FL=1
MTWEPSEIKGWAIVGYGFDEIEELLTVIAHPLESIMLTSRRLEKEGIGCDDTEFKGIIEGLEGIESDGLDMDNWNWCYYRLFSQFSDAMYTCDTVVGAGPGLSWCAIGIYVREGREQAFAELFSEFANRFEHWAEKAIRSKAVVEQPDAVDPEEVRVRLAKLWGVDPAKIRFRDESSEFIEPDTIFIRGMDLKPAVSSNQPKEKS